MSTNSEWQSTTNQYIKYRVETTLNSQNIANNSSNITVKVWIYRTNTGYTTSGSGTCYCKINGTTYTQSITSSQKITNSGIYLFSKTLDIGHNSDGTKSMDVTAWFDHSQFTSTPGGYNISLATIPRKSTISSVTGGTINSSMTVNIDRKSSSFTTTVWLQLGSSGWIQVATKSTATAITFTVPSSLANYIPNATSGNGQVIIRTYDANGNNLGDSTSGKQFSVPNYSPSIGTFSVSETGSGIGIYVQNKSRIQYSGAASTSYGAKITNYTWKIGSATLTSASGTTGVWGSSGNVNISLTVKDSRGKTASKSTTVNFIGYSAPVAKISGYRCDDSGNYDTNGTKVRATITGTVSSVSGKNTIAIEVRAKDKSTGSWGEPRTYNTNQTNAVLTLNNYSTEKAYTLQIKVTDKWTTSIAVVEIPTSFVLIDFKGGGKSLAIGKVAESDEYVEIAKPIKFYDRFEPKYFQTSSSAGDYSDGYMTKFARVDLSIGSNYSICEGTLSIQSIESNAISGNLRYYFRRNGSGGMNDVQVYWMTSDGGLMKDAIIVVQVDALIFDLYWRPYANWVTLRGYMMEGHGQGYMTFYDKQPFVPISSQTAYRTSNFAVWGSRNVSGNWWNNGVTIVQSNGVSHIGKFLDFHATNEDTSGYTTQLYSGNNILYSTGNFYPATNGNRQLGSTDLRWQWINLVNSPSVSSDRTMKENIEYVRNGDITYTDMYNFVKDDLELAKYNFIGQEKTEMNFIAQDLLYNLDGTDNKVGQFIVEPIAPNTEEEIAEIKANLEEGQEYHDPTLSYDMGNYVSVLAGALKTAINKIEDQQKQIDELQVIINELKGSDE